jgi:hypothetical protein
MLENLWVWLREWYWFVILAVAFVLLAVVLAVFTPLVVLPVVLAIGGVAFALLSLRT